MDMFYTCILICILIIKNIFLLIIIFFKFQIVQDSYFESGIYLWIIGVVLIVICVAFRKEYRMELLLVNINKVESAELGIRHLTYLIKILNHYR